MHSSIEKNISNRICESEPFWT